MVMVTMGTAKFFIIVIIIIIDLSFQAAPHGTLLPAAVSLRQILDQSVGSHQHICACCAVSFGSECA